MGVSHQGREATDRMRPVHVRSQGSKKYPVFGLQIPAWLTREITGSADPEEQRTYYQQFQFEAERTADGILFRPVRLVKEAGW